MRAFLSRVAYLLLRKDQWPQGRKLGGSLPCARRGHKSPVIVASRAYHLRHGATRPSCTFAQARLHRPACAKSSGRNALADHHARIGA